MARLFKSDKNLLETVGALIPTGDKTYTCDTCGFVFNPVREGIYIARAIDFSLPTGSEWNAMDCPQCGCQNLLSKHRARQITKKGVMSEKEE